MAREPREKKQKNKKKRARNVREETNEKATVMGFLKGKRFPLLILLLLLVSVAIFLIVVSNEMPQKHHHQHSGGRQQALVLREPIVHGEVNEGHPVSFLFDTGSDVSKCGRAQQKLFCGANGLQKVTGAQTASGITGTARRILGRCTAQLRLHGRTVQLEMQVMDQERIVFAGWPEFDAILGRNTIALLSPITVDFSANPERFISPSIQPVRSGNMATEIQLNSHIVDAEVNGHRVKMIVDTGFPVSLCAIGLAKRVGCTELEPCDWYKGVGDGFGDKGIPFLGMCEVRVSLGGISASPVHLHVVDRIPNRPNIDWENTIIAGLNVITTFSPVTFDFGAAKKESAFSKTEL